MKGNEMVIKLVDSREALAKTRSLGFGLTLAISGLIYMTTQVGMLKEQIAYLKKHVKELEEGKE